MADDYRQYTSCCNNSSWASLPVYITLTLIPLVAGLVGAAILAGWCALFFGLVLIAAETVVSCIWWHDVRLICLGGDRSLAAMLVSVEPSRGKNGFFDRLDTDYSINLLPYPAVPGISQADAAELSPYGVLLKDSGLGHGFVGYLATEPKIDKNAPEIKSAVVHAEFEGAGMHDFLIGAWISLGFAVAAFLACALIPPPWGLIVAAILAILAFLAWLLSRLFGSRDYADPTETKGTPSEFHTNDPTSHLGADLLYVSGTWVYDSFHEGWNELHPIKKCTVMGTWTGAWPTDTIDKVKRLDDAFEDAGSNDTIDRQSKPTNRWEIHPLIDGCGSYLKPRLKLLDGHEGPH
jgi:hypothetical protein